MAKESIRGFERRKHADRSAYPGDQEFDLSSANCGEAVSQQQLALGSRRCFASDILDPFD